MFDTYVTIVGNVLNMPEWRRTTNTGAVVVSFKVASTARRMNRETGQWEDGNSLRVRVNCWRRLAENVGTSVRVGDPVVVVGRLYTRDWVDEAGSHRLAYEVEAVALGHDLAKGRARFARVKAAGGTSMVDDAEAESRVGGQLTTALPADEVPVPPADFDDLDTGSVLSPDGWGGRMLDSLAGQRPEPIRLDDDPFGEPGPARTGDPDEPEPGGPGAPFGPSDPETGDEEPGEGEPGRRRRRRMPVPA